MTIKEAVEQYNEVQDKIKDIKTTIKDIYSHNYIKSPLGDYQLSPEEMKYIAKYLQEYIEMLENILEKEF